MLFGNVVFSIIFLVILDEIQASTYFFNINKTSNEYIIRTRFNQVNYQSNPSSEIQLGELRNNVTRKETLVIKTPTPVPTLLDTEWNYNSSNITKSKLPVFIHKYYEIFSKNMTSSEVRFLFNSRPLNSRIFTISLENISIYENITALDLHFFHKVNKTINTGSLILRLYQMENNVYNESSIINPDSHKLLNVIYMNQAENGWQVFKLTNSFGTWFNKNTSLSLFITISKPNEESFVFYNNSNMDSLRSFISIKIGNPTDFPQVEARSHNNCQRRDLYIDFNTVNWNKFIIAPSGYHAYTCFGACLKNEKLTNHLKITNLKRKNLCCVATDYASLPIMFYDKNENVAIKIYNDMIITQCGCR